MSKLIFSFDDIEIKKNTIHNSKYPIDINEVSIDKTRLI